MIGKTTPASNIQKLASPAKKSLVEGETRSTKTSSTEDVKTEKKIEDKVEIDENRVRKETVDKALKTYSPKAISVNGKEKGLKKPAIFFIGGLNMVSGVSAGPYDGMKLMAESVDGARYYEWDQVHQMTKEILKRRKDQAIVLIGHSLGGDTAVELAHQLNKLENGFRQVDLLVTVDSVGKGNDIIPSNVKKNLNIIGRDQGVFNDGPNIADNSEKTKIENILRNEEHTEIDNSREVQADIIHAITDAIFQKKYELKT